MMQGLIRITENDHLLAVILKHSFQNSGIRFFTPDSFSQQLAYMNRPKGHQIVAHTHNFVSRHVERTNEVLFIKSGKVRVDFYGEKQKYRESVILTAGDVILLVAGGHGFEMLEPTEMIEVKQGPYAGAKDKTTFPGIDSSKILIRDNEA